MTRIDPISELAGIWPYDGTTRFSDWVMRVAGNSYSSSLPLEAVARIMGCTIAELQGLLRLSFLEPERLERLDEVTSKATTWFLFADVQSDEEFHAGLDALKHLKDGESAFSAVLAAMNELAAPNVFERIRSLSSGCFWHLAHKAKEYDVLSKKGRAFLAQVAKLKTLADRNRKELALSEKQLDWLLALLWELVQKGVVSRNSVDSDQEYCDAVLEALGREG